MLLSQISSPTRNHGVGTAHPEIGLRCVAHAIHAPGDKSKLLKSGGTRMECCQLYLGRGADTCPLREYQHFERHHLRVDGYWFGFRCVLLLVSLQSSMDTRSKTKSMLPLPLDPVHLSSPDRVYDR